MVFTPRTNSMGMYGNPKWYSQNPFYPKYGLPNCTCYAWGRWWEINDPTGLGINRPTLNLAGNAKNWWGNNIGQFEHGQTPQLGAIICFTPVGIGASTANGHVAVVEEIRNNGVIVTSNSYWKGSYFALETLTPDANGKYHHYAYISQGFLYNPYIDKTPEPTPEEKAAKKRDEFPWAIAWKHWQNFKH